MKVPIQVSVKGRKHRSLHQPRFGQLFDGSMTMDDVTLVGLLQARDNVE